MATPSASRQNADYFASRPAPRARPSASVLATAGSSPRSPRTPIIGRSISGQFGSPGGSFSREQEELIVYELHPRYLSAGFAGESRPRCVHRFGYQVGDGRRPGDLNEFAPGKCKKGELSMKREGKDWTAEYELFSADVRDLDLGLVEDRLERAVRAVTADYLQLDAKPRRAVLVVPSLLPTPLVEVALRVLFQASAQPPAVTLLSTPLLACVGAGIRNGLVVDIGWEETVVTAVGEYKAVAEQRSVLAGKALTGEMGEMLNKVLSDDEWDGITFSFAEDVTQRMGWCKPQVPSTHKGDDKIISIPIPNRRPRKTLDLPFSRLAEPTESVFFSPSPDTTPDDHELPVPQLIYNALLALPLELRAICMSRIILTGSTSKLPGLRRRLLQELEHLIATRGWDIVHNYGSASSSKVPLHYRMHDLSVGNMSRTKSSTHSVHLTQDSSSPQPRHQQPVENPVHVPAHERPHDHLTDWRSQMAAREASKGRVEEVKGVVRAVETLGAWAGASLVGAMRIKGVVEVEREEFVRSGLKDGVLDVL